MHTIRIVCVLMVVRSIKDWRVRNKKDLEVKKFLTVFLLSVESGTVFCGPINVGECYGGGRE